MKSQVVAKEETPMQSKIKGVTECTLAAINIGNQFDIKAIDAIVQDNEVIREFDKEYHRSLKELYCSATSAEEKERIMERMEKQSSQVHETNREFGDRVERMQENNKKYNIWILSFLLFAGDRVYHKFRKPVHNIVQKSIRAKT